MLLCLALAAWPLAAPAGLLEGEPYVSFKLERDSNVFRFEDRAEAMAVSGDQELADTRRRYAAGMALQYSFGLTRLSLGGELRRVEYAHFEQLDHDSHRVYADADWQLGRVASGSLGVEQERRLESFADRDSDELSLQSDTRAHAAGTLALTPRWALQTRLDTRRLRNSSASSRNYNLDETSGSVGGVYLGLPVGTAGASIEYVRGRYPEREAAAGVTDRYDQLSVKLNGTWRPSGLSTLRLSAGHTRRDGAGGAAGDFSGFTGRAAYERRWSGKTTLHAELFRRVVSAGEVDANFIAQNGVGAGFDWQAATKLGVFGSYELRRDDYDGSPALDVGGDARRDHLQQAELGLEYKPVFWLSLTPSVAYEQRDSNRERRSYEGTILSLEVEARYD